MRIDSQLLERQAASSGFRADILETVIRLGDLAADIGRHPLLGRVLVLKGGTAINLCFGPPRRLSVDLDFNYIGALERAEMREERPLVELALREMASRKGYRVQQSADQHAGRKLHIGYTASDGSQNRLEIDINYLFREPIAELMEAKLWQPAGFVQPTIRMVGIEELSAGKICALLSRVLSRDLFDVANLPEIAGNTWGSSYFRKLVIAFSAVLEHPLSSYGRSRLDRVGQSEVETHLVPMLSRRVAVNATELQRRAWAAIAPILDLTAEERTYVDSVQHGELRPELLFPADSVTTERLARHPALQWKALNAKQFKAGQRTEP